MQHHRTYPRQILSALAALGLVAGLGAVPSNARAPGTTSLSLRDTFPIGSNGLCEAQIVAPEPGAGLFDRRYAIICRDAAAPVGTMWVVKGTADDTARFAGAGSTCARQAAADAAALPGLPSAQRLTCARPDSILRTDLLLGTRGGRTFAASGLSAYGKALELGLASLASDEVVPGTVEIPLTSTTDAVAFARQQASTISADRALVEAYRRSNAGNFAEAAEFFAASAAALAGPGGAEARLNEALQQSNLGNYSEARRLFAASRAVSASSPVLARLQRNYEAMDALNQRRSQAALTILDTPLAVDQADAASLRALQIDRSMASQLASESDRGAGGFSAALSPRERAELLDGQHAYLKATALRQLGRTADASALLRSAEGSFASVRGGRVVSVAWLRAQVLGELAELAERSGSTTQAEALHMDAIALLETTYPGSPALGSARAQLAGLYARAGNRDAALAIYRSIVADAEGRALPSLRSLMTPISDCWSQGRSASAALRQTICSPPASCSSAPASRRRRPRSRVNCRAAATKPRNCSAPPPICRAGSNSSGSRCSNWRTCRNSLRSRARC